MEKENKYLNERTTDIKRKFNESKQTVEDYIKAASFLSFSNKTEDAIDLLQHGLTHYPLNEEIIRAIFSFMCQNFQVLQALEFAEAYEPIFNDDEYDNITKAIDLVRLSLNFYEPEQLSLQQIAEIDEILRLYYEEDKYDVAMITIGLMDEYHLPFVGLGIAKHLALNGDAFAQMVLGGAYLKGYHLHKDLIKAEHYLSQSAKQGNQEAMVLLEKVTKKKDFN